MLSCLWAKSTVLFADALLALGFGQSTIAGISICIDDILVPEQKKEIIASTDAKVQEYKRQVEVGQSTVKESHNKIIDAWKSTTEKVTDALLTRISTENVLELNEALLKSEDADTRRLYGKPKSNADGSLMTQPSFNNIYMMVDSGARGSKTQIRQLGGMRGLITRWIYY